MNIKKILEYTYVSFAILLFSFTALGKLFSNFSDPKLKGADPFLFFISSGHLLVFIAIIELVVVVLLGRSLLRGSNEGLPLTLWLCSLFAVYRVGFYFAPTKTGSCKCFGVGSFFGKMEQKADAASLNVLSVMLVIGSVLLMLRWFNKRKPAGSPTGLMAIYILSVIGFFGGSARADVFSPLYTAQGIVTENLVRKSGETNKQRDFPFKVSVDAKGQWQIMWQNYFPEWSATSTEYVSFNGTDVFSVVYSDKKLGKDMKPIDNTPFEDHQHPARVCRGPFPVDHSSCVGLLWIAFCGGGYLERPQAGDPPFLLVSNARTDPIAWATVLQSKMIKDSSNPLIEQCSFTLSKKKMSADLIDYPELDEPKEPARLQNLLKTLKHFKEVKDEDLERGFYSLNESKIFGGVRVPIRFVATRFSIPDSVEGRYPSVKWDVVVTNVSFENASSSPLPPIMGAINVQDRRFKQRTETAFRNDIYYLLGKEGWRISTNDPGFHGTNTMLLGKRQSVVLRKNGYLLSVIIFSLLGVLPIWILIKRKMKK